MKDENHCTGFPEHWYTWGGKRIHIGWMCKDHDNHDEGEQFKGCANTGFFEDTWNAHLIGAVLIASVASIACWIKYFNKQKKRI